MGTYKWRNENTAESQHISEKIPQILWIADHVCSCTISLCISRVTVVLKITFSVVNHLKMESKIPWERGGEVCIEDSIKYDIFVERSSWRASNFLSFVKFIVPSFFNVLYFLKYIWQHKPYHFHYICSWNILVSYREEYGKWELLRQ